MSATVTTLRLLWPFLKEMVLGDKTLSEALKTNKMRVLLLFLIVGSFAMNFFVVPRVYEISSQYVELEREHKKLLEANQDVLNLTSQNAPLTQELDQTKLVVADTQQQLRTSKSNEKYLRDQLELCKSTKPNCPVPPPTPTHPSTRYDEYKRRLDQMRRDESK